MIYTVTLNPALDRMLVVERLLEDDTTRIISEQRYAGGKGIDVSRVIKELGGHSVALGFVGGYDGLELEGRLINDGILTRFIRISDSTRVNVILKENSTGRQYVISTPGPTIKPSELGQIYHQILSLRDAEYVVISGSLPRGVSPTIYSQFILATRELGAIVAIDTDGDALREAIEYRPDIIKPNRHELARLLQRELFSIDDIVKGAVEIHNRGIRYVIASMGKDGLILIAEEKRLYAIAPQVQVESTVGAGDSVLGAFILAHSRGMSIKECLRIACAAGTATAMTPGTELCHRETVEKILESVRVEEI
jgi:6-phosphofructokinase 2